MSITLSPTKAAYLVDVAAGLADLSSEDRDDVIQDLEAHLAELEDESVERILGTPEEFVSEFRSSAGLDIGRGVGLPALVERWRAALNRSSARLGDITHWHTFRPVWIWIRGWLLVSAWSLLYDYEGFSRFPIPSVGQSTGIGLALIVGATWLSLWLDRATEAQRIRSIGSVTYSVLAALALSGMLLNPMPTYPELVSHFEEQPYFEHLVNSDGEPIENIYAYDVGGRPVEVLLFDQAGRPILNLPRYVYEDAEYLPANQSYGYGDGAVDFNRDDFGRIIPNLYPLQLSKYDQNGSLQPVAPPSLGFPSIDESPTGASLENSATTLGSVR